MNKNTILQYTLGFFLINILAWSGTTAFALEKDSEAKVAPTNPTEVIIGRKNLVAATNYDKAMHQDSLFSPRKAGIIPKYKRPSFIDYLNRIATAVLLNFRLIALSGVIIILLYAYRKAVPLLMRARVSYAKFKTKRYVLILPRPKKAS